MYDTNEYASMKSSNSMLESPDNEVSLRIMQYNVQMLRSHHLNVNWWKRGTYVIDHVLTLQRELDVDVIVFNEVFYKQFFQDLQKSISNLFPYNTPIVNGKIKENEESWKVGRSVNGKFHLLNGGIVIFSKYPIVQTHQLIFNNANGVSKLVSKGAVLAKVLKNGKYFNIVGTHFQPGINDKDHTCRMKQAAQLANWIRTGFSDYKGSMSGSIEIPKPKVVDTDETGTANSKMIPLEHMNTVDVYKSNNGVSGLVKSFSSSKTFQNVNFDQKLPPGVLNHEEPLIYVGDFNIRYEQDSKWLLAMIDSECLNAKLAINPKAHVVNTFDSTTNDYCKFVNNDRSLQYNETLDYFFLSNDCVGDIKTHQKTIDKQFAGDINLTKFLLVIPVKHVVVHHPSDHFPILAEFSVKK